MEIKKIAILASERNPPNIWVSPYQVGFYVWILVGNVENDYGNQYCRLISLMKPKVAYEF